MQLRPGWRTIGLFVILASLVVPAGFGMSASATGTSTTAHPPSYLRAPSLPSVSLSQAMSAARPNAPTKTASLNWAGYVDYDRIRGRITEVFAEWTIPKATCPTTAPARTEQVQWVGIDGFGSSTVEQVGTYDSCTGSGATPVYGTWWEFFPAESLHQYRPANPGDLVEAYVLYDPFVSSGGGTGLYTLTLEDLTAGYAFTKVGNPSAGPDVSAECISEAPSTSAGAILPLTNYGTTSFLTCDATIHGTFTGIGAYSVVYAVRQVGTSSSTVQAVSGLTRVDYPADHFSISWKAYS